ncbi:MAG: SIMPL domain-containing protein [Anaerolineaceae bacterium]|nr:SIMPL domain-containing protein [Anaerolineaceae bacterium]
MRKTIHFVVLSVLVLGLLSACAYNATAPAATNTRSMNVSGSGQVTLVPDLASISIGVRTEADDVTDALSGNTDKANAISTVLANYGVASEDIKTSNFNVYPSDRYDPMTGEIISHYFVVENTVIVIVRDLSKLGEILSATVNAGANSIYGISFDVEDRESAINQARELAIQDAKAKAQAIADAAGVDLGNLLSINVYSTNSPVTYYDSKGGAYSASSIPVSAGTLTVTIECSLTYELK